MKSEEKILNHIKKYGWHIIHVLGAEQGSQYSYTIGLTASYEHTEIVISGLNQNTSSQLLNEMVESIRQGNKYEANHSYNDILEGYACIFKVVSPEKYGDFFGKANWYYGEKRYKVNQCFYPDKNNLFPWDDGYNVMVQEII